MTSALKVVRYCDGHTKGISILVPKLSILNRVTSALKVRCTWQGRYVFEEELSLLTNVFACSNLLQLRHTAADFTFFYNAVLGPVNSRGR